MHCHGWSVLPCVTLPHHPLPAGGGQDVGQGAPGHWADDPGTGWVEGVDQGQAGGEDVHPLVRSYSGNWAIHLSQMQPCQYVFMLHKSWCLLLKIDNDLDSVTILLHSQHSQPQHHLLVLLKSPHIQHPNLHVQPRKTLIWVGDEAPVVPLTFYSFLRFESEMKSWSLTDWRTTHLFSLYFVNMLDEKTSLALHNREELTMSPNLCS